jgi:hypothetical protein
MMFDFYVGGSGVRFSSDIVKKILACDQISEGMEFDKRPSNQELAFGHILLCHQECRRVVPRDLTELLGCTPESLRLMLRKAEKGKFLASGGRPHYEIIPLPKLLWLIHEVSQEWLLRNQRRLMPFSPTVREVYTVTQAFDIYSRINNRHGFMFKSPVKRGIVFFLLDRMHHGPIELKRLKYNFPIDHESLRQFINMTVDAGYFEKLRDGKQTFIGATKVLKEKTDILVDEVCVGLNKSDQSLSIYSDFIDWLNVGLEQNARAAASTASVR